MKAPDFTLQDQHGKEHSLKDYLGKWVVLYFYPKDDTPGCTKEACAFRDSWSQFEQNGIVVLGVSADSVRSHKKFADKYGLNFPLLSDPERKTISDYKAWGLKKLFGRDFDGILRKTVLIGPDGSIAKEYPDVTPDKHVPEILADLENLRQ